MDKVVAIIQARMGSSRLPGKIAKNLFGKTILEHVIERVRQSKTIDDIVIATTELEKDDRVVELAIKSGVKFFRGSEDDVLSRYYFAAKENSADIIIRITSDCPLIDPYVVDDLTRLYINNDYVLVTNAGSNLKYRTYPRGLDTEVFSFYALEQAFLKATEKYQREHVTPFIYENNLDVYYYMNDIDYSNYRWTLDTKEDFKLIKCIYDELYKREHNFYLNDIIDLMIKKPELPRINLHIEQKGLK